MLKGRISTSASCATGHHLCVDEVSLTDKLGLERVAKYSSLFYSFSTIYPMRGHGELESKTKQPFTLTPGGYLESPFNLNLAFWTVGEGRGTRWLPHDDDDVYKLVHISKAPANCST